MPAGAAASGGLLDSSCMPSTEGRTLPPCADFHWVPTADMLGHSPSEVAVNILAVLPVISLSFICQ